MHCESKPAEIHRQRLDTPHNLFPVGRSSLDKGAGVTRAEAEPPIVVPDQVAAIRSLAVLRKANGSPVLLMEEFGTVQALVTPLDVTRAVTCV